LDRQAGSGELTPAGEVLFGCNYRGAGRQRLSPIATVLAALEKVLARVLGVYPTRERARAILTREEKCLRVVRANPLSFGVQLSRPTSCSFGGGWRLWSLALDHDENSSEGRLSRAKPQDCCH
jgi:hypothetical protein